MGMKAEPDRKAKGESESEYDRFKRLTKRLLQVPKKEVKQQEKKKAG